MYKTITDFKNKLEDTEDILDVLYSKIELSKLDLQAALNDKGLHLQSIKTLNRANEIFNRYNEFKEWLDEQIIIL